MCSRDYKPSAAVIVALLCTFLGVGVYAQYDSAATSSKAGKGDPDTKVTVAMSQPVFEKLAQAQDLIDAKQYDAGRAILQGLRDGKKALSSYEAAQVWNLTAYSFYLQERYPAAIKAYDKVLSQGELPQALVQSTLKTLSQLYFTVENYRQALATVKKLIALIDEPSADIYMLMGQAYYQLQEYDNAVVPIKTAIAKYRAQGQKPKENWLLLLRAIYYEKNNYKAMIGVLKELLALYPRKQYFLSLGGIYSELGDTKKQLAITEALYAAGLLSDEANIVNLANLYLLHGVPYKAAKILQAAVDENLVERRERNLRLLSQAWYQARENEKSIAPLAQAARISADGELYVRLAQSYINLERWAEASNAIRQGLKKGGVKRTATANVMLGMTLFNQHRLNAARSAFARALKSKGSKRVAQQWIAYVDTEIKRRETLAQELPELLPRVQDAVLENL
jgi:tetratricopeptide (TPR) repeat protein